MISTKGRTRLISSTKRAPIHSRTKNTPRTPKRCLQRPKPISTRMVPHRNSRMVHSDPRACRLRMMAVRVSVRRSTNQKSTSWSRSNHHREVSDQAKADTQTSPTTMPISSQNLSLACSSLGRGSRSPEGRRRRPEIVIPATRNARRSLTSPSALTTRSPNSIWSSLARSTLAITSGSSATPETLQVACDLIGEPTTSPDRPSRLEHICTLGESEWLWVLSDTPWIPPEMKGVSRSSSAASRRIAERSPAEDQLSEEPPKPAQSSPAWVIVGGVDRALEELCSEPSGVPVARSRTTE